MIRAGIFGATGYMGGEAARVLLQHPDVKLAWLASRSGASLAEHHPNLYGLELALSHPDDVGECDVVFLAVPTEASLAAAPRFLEQGAKVVDLGAAFRLKQRDAWQRAYGLTHTQWELVNEAPYGVNELHRAEIEQARLVANPGCFSSAAILALAPLLSNGLVDRRHLVVQGLSGTAGVGAELARAAHHPEIGNNLVAYNVVDHRHSLEMEQELSACAGQSVSVHFTPVYVPIVRGILAVCHAFPLQTLGRGQLLDLYRDYYQAHPFVQVYDLPKDAGAGWQYKPYPWVSAVAGTNYCHIGLDVDEARGRVVVFSALDSLGKGGAQVGIENMNLMFGLRRDAGLTRRGGHPG